MRDPRTCLSFWYPILQSAGLPAPRTEVVRVDGETLSFLGGYGDELPPAGYHNFLKELGDAAAGFGFPCFLRTGMGSGKHEWRETCFLPSLESLPSHVKALVEWSMVVDILGLPFDVFVVREFLPLRTFFTLPRYGDMPVAREFRGFIRGGRVVCLHPYWPAGAIEAGGPPPGWREHLPLLRDLGEDEPAVRELLGRVAREFEGYWSVDVCQDAAGSWWVTDMAIGGESFHWEDCENARGT